MKRYFARMGIAVRSQSAETLVFCLCILGFGIVLSFLPKVIVNLCLLIGVLGLVHQTLLVYHDRSKWLTWLALSRLPSWGIFSILMSIAFGYYLLAIGATIIHGIILVALLFVSFYFWYILPAAWFQLQHQVAADTEENPPTVPLSILVPAYNESGYIGQCIDSLVNATYPGPKEIVVIDDGSTDKTYQEACAHATENVHILRQENGGKASALNSGLERATGAVVITVDADSRVTSSSLVEIVADLQADSSLGAVAGTVKLSRIDTIIEKLQALEYAVGLNTFRRAFAVTGAVNVVPGCLGCFRRDAIDEVAGYDGDTMTEDYDITLQILKAGWGVRASEALVYTEAPRTWRGLAKQRLRWKYGNIEALLKHVECIRWTDRSTFSGLIFPYQLVSLFAMPIATLVILWTIIIGVTAGQWMYIATVVALFAVLELLGTIFALKLDDDSLWLSVYSPLILVVYRHFIAAITLIAMVDVLRHVERTWESPRSDPTQPGTETADEQECELIEVSNVGESND